MVLWNIKVFIYNFLQSFIDEWVSQSCWEKPQTWVRGLISYIQFKSLQYNVDFGGNGGGLLFVL